MQTLHYTSPDQSPFKLAWKLSFPVLISYFSLGMVFGILFNNLHEPWYYAPIMSLFVYSGAVQFVAIGIMASHGSYWLILLSTVFIAGRNAFYGLSLLDRFRVKWWYKLYLIFGLVDANYAIFATTPPYQDKRQDRNFCLYLTALIHSYWVFGTLIGAYFANKLLDLKGLEFILIAFFAILILEHYLKTKSLLPITIGMGSAFIALFIVPFHAMLVSAIFMSAISLIILYIRERYVAT